jgi:metal dependent phosphohydrolase
MAKNTFFALLSRMKYINRWGLMRNLEKESLSEHSFDVAVLAGALTSIENSRFNKNINVERVTTLALYHDCTEIITGDMPTPVKYHGDEIRRAYKGVENAARQKLLNALPDELNLQYKQYLTVAPGTPEYDIIKAADKLSALIKCLGEAAGANHDFDSAAKTLSSALKRSSLGSVKVFMDEFMPAYGCTLDELMED